MFNRYVISIVICCFITVLNAYSQNLCFLLYNLNQNKIVKSINQSLANRKTSPNSTFKIPLSLMSFDQGLICQNTKFTWDKINRELKFWNQDQTPKTWLQNSVVWVSQKLTLELGYNLINTYLEKFNYGNKDFSGDKYKQNGLQKAWLESSLRISPLEQLDFLKNLLNYKIPVSRQAIENTIDNLYILTSNKNWKLYGKTGSGKNNNQKYDWIDKGWFIGFLKKDNKAYIFVFNCFNKNTNSKTYAGIRAKRKVISMLNEFKLFGVF